MYVQALGEFFRKKDIQVKLENIKKNLMMEVKQERDGYQEVAEGEAQAVEGLGWEEDAGDGEWDEWDEEEDMEEVEVEEGGTAEEAVEEVMSSGDEGKVAGGGGSGGGGAHGAHRYKAPWAKRQRGDWIVSTDKWGGQRYNSGWYCWNGKWYPFPGW